MSKQPGDNTTQNILIEAMAEQGIELTVRDNDAHMEASADKTGKYLANQELHWRKMKLERKEKAARGDVDYSDAVNQTYERGNTKD